MLATYDGMKMLATYDGMKMCGLAEKFGKMFGWKENVRMSGKSRAGTEVALLKCITEVPLIASATATGHDSHSRSCSDIRPMADSRLLTFVFSSVQIVHGSSVQRIVRGSAADRLCIGR